MMRALTIAVAVGTTAVLALAGEAGAQSSRSGSEAGQSSASSARAKRPQVRSYAKRGGGYSYSASDVINTYGDNRSRFGGTSVYRDPLLDRQTNFGPFDHGFFFDSGIGARGGYSPYPN